MKRRGTLAAALSLALLAGCAVPPPGPASVAGEWAGRLALQVEGQANQSFSASFELKGSPRSGELSLRSPVGSTIALLSWSPGKALMRAGSDVREASSIDELAASLTGAPLPVTAMFDWLQGRATPVAGWQPDLARLAEGRLSARRSEPAPQADLRVVLDR